MKHYPWVGSYPIWVRFEITGTATTKNMQWNYGVTETHGLILRHIFYRKYKKIFLG